MQKAFQVILFLFFSIHLISCQEQNPCLLSKEVLDDIQMLDSLATLPEVSQRDKEWLKPYNEPSMLNINRETYRFMWMSSFDTTLIDRIEEIDGHYKLTRRVFASHADTIGVTTEYEIQKSDWDTIVNGLAAYNFWTYPFASDRRGLDGASWVLEAYKPVKDKCTNKNYHRIQQWSPIDTTFISMCDLLYKLKRDTTSRSGF